MSNSPKGAAHLGRSNAKGFTGQGEHHLAPTSVAGLVPYTITGPGKTFTGYLKPGQSLLDKIRYQHSQGRTVSGPGTREIYAKGLHLIEKPVAPQVPAVPIAPVAVSIVRDTPKGGGILFEGERRDRGYNRRAIVHIDTGTYYPSAPAAGKATRLSKQMVNYAVNNNRPAKGHRFRLATDQEIAANTKPAEPVTLS